MMSVIRGKGMQIEIGGGGGGDWLLAVEGKMGYWLIGIIIE